MSALTWTTLQESLLVMLAQSPPPYNVIPPNFAALFPQATSYAEGRIYKALVLLATRQQNATLITSAGNRNLTLSSMVNASGGPIIVPEGLALISPATSAPSTGTRVPYDEASLDVIDLIWPTEATTVAPASAEPGTRMWAMRDNNTIVYCPTADGAYRAEISGLYQPTPISAGNPSTYLSSVYPELLQAACMVFLTGGLLRNFGAQAADPATAISWENQYKMLEILAVEEEYRRRGLQPNIAKPQASGPAQS